MGSVEARWTSSPAAPGDVVETLARDVEKSADHDLEVPPIQLALADPDLSDAARRVLEAWAARQAEEAERALVRAEMWTATRT